MTMQIPFWIRQPQEGLFRAGCYQRRVRCSKPDGISMVILIECANADANANANVRDFFSKRENVNIFRPRFFVFVFLFGRYLFRYLNDGIFAPSGEEVAGTVKTLNELFCDAFPINKQDTAQNVSQTPEYRMPMPMPMPMPTP